MLFIAAAALAAAPSFLSAPSADPWSGYLAAHRRQHRYALLLRKGEFQGPWMASEALLRARVNDELAISVLEPETAAILWQAKDWHEAKWVLLGPDGSMLQTGTLLPIPDEVLDTMSHSGWVPLKEKRAAFLRKHPDQLEARLDALREAADLALRRAAQAKARATLGFKVTLDLAAADSEKRKDGDVVWAEAADALDDLGKQDGWPLASGLGTTLERLRFSGAAASPAIRDRAPRLLTDIEAEIRRHPFREDLWKAWSYMAALAPGSHGVGLLESLDPVPGEPWPPPPASQALVAHFREMHDWAGLLQQAEAQWNAPWPGRVWTKAVWLKARLDRVQSWGLAKLWALEELKREDERAAWIGELRRVSGSGWSSVQPLLSEPDAKGVRQRLFEKSMLPDPPMPQAPEPLKVSVSRDLSEVRSRAELAIYGPSELQWEVGNKDGWALQQGDKRLAAGLWSGELVKAIEREGIPALAKLEGFLTAHRDHADARQVLAEQLRAQMPDRVLEPMLLRVVRAGVAFHPGNGWRLNEDDWGTAARQVVPNLEAELEKRPSDPDLWRAWVDWASVHPAHPSARGLLETIPVFGPREAWAWGLPDSLHAMVVAELQQRKAWRDLRAWTQPMFDWMMEQEAETLAELSRFQTLVAKPLIQALRALGQTGEAATADQQVDAWLKSQKEAMTAASK